VLEAALHFLPHFILLDIEMPALDGCQVASLLRQEEMLEDTLLVAVTGWGDDRHKEAAKHAGCDLHLVEPVTEVVLGALLAEVGSRKRA
jgi:CheY-like chemotaxis protein